ncbi:MAG TPA: hypothetical protein VFQ74_04175 [Pseudolysinimonas sp.]|nr:hypothetical protein [Pseudolysinimonas sp.]
MTGSRAAHPGRRRLRAAQPRLRRLLLILRPTPRGALAAAAALTAGILVAAGLAVGSYAFLNSQASATSAVTIQSGNLALAVQYGSGAAGSTATIPTTAWATMLPGDVVGQQFTLASTGTAGATITARLSAVSAWEIRVAPGTCPATQLAVAPLTTTAATEGTIPGGSATPVCVQATLPSSAAATLSGTTVGFSIILDSTQVPS